MIRVPAGRLVRATTGLLLCAVLGIATPRVTAQTPGFAITQAVNQGEVRLPGIGWRRAVVGRTLPSGSVLTSWVASRIVAESESLTLFIGPLSYVDVASVLDPAQVTVRAGEIRVQTEASIEVDVVRNGYRLSGRDVDFTLSRDRLVVDRGTLVVARPGNEPLPVAAGASLTMTLHPRGPILPGHGATEPMR